MRYFLYLFIFILSTSNVFGKSKILLFVKNGEHEIGFSLEDFRKYKKYNIETTTRWSNGEKIKYTGVRLIDILGKTENFHFVYAYGFNNYVSVIPIEKIVKYNPIIAFMANEKIISVKEKGPLWIIFPYDKHPELQTHIAEAWYVWHLNKILLK